MSSRRLEDVFGVTIFRLPRLLQDVYKTPSRRVCKKSSKDIFKASAQDVKDVFKTSSQDVLTRCLRKTSSRRFEDVFKTSSRLVCKTSSRTSCNYALKTSWKTRNATLKRSSVRLHQDKCLLGI